MEDLNNIPTQGFDEGSQPSIADVRLAQEDDKDFLIKMSQYASVIEDRPLPDPTSEETLGKLPTSEDIAIVACGASGERLGAIWIYHHEPPLLTDENNMALPEIIIAVTEEARGNGVGSQLLDQLDVVAATKYKALSLNVHVRNPARNLYLRKGFVDVGQGRGELGIAMKKDLAH